MSTRTVPAPAPAPVPASSSAADTAVVVPVKRSVRAKSRLSALGDDARRRLAAAFAADTVASVLACTAVARVLVVTDDHELAETLRALGAEVIPDGAGDLNGTLVQAAAEVHRRDPSLRVAAVCADLPALRPDDLAAALAAAAPDRMSFVPDAARTGTTVVVAPGLEDFRPAFGPGSRDAHLDQGALELDRLDAPGLRRDVDDPADLAEALAMGAGPQTSAVARDLHLGRGVAQVGGR
jgi:2-phospho-L-lactate guanylyltransferase